MTSVTYLNYSLLFYCFTVADDTSVLLNGKSLNYNLYPHGLNPTSFHKIPLTPIMLSSIELELNYLLILDGTLVGMSQLRIPWSDSLIESAILLPLVSVNAEYQDGWLKSPRIRMSCVVRKCSIED